jgi:hypothetical protein
MSALLRSHGRDPRLQGVSNGISYNQQESAQVAAYDNTAISDRNSHDGSIRDSDLETPHNIFAEEEEEESTTHNATNGTHNAINQRNGRSTTAAAATARSRHPNGNANTPPPPTIITIDAALKTKIEALLIKKTHEFDRDLINGAINQVIGNRNSLLRAAMKLGRELAGGSPTAVTFPPSPDSYQVCLGQAISHMKLAQKTLRPNVVIVMVRVFQILYEMFQHTQFTVQNTLATELESFTYIVESTMHEWRAVVARSNLPNDKFAKGVVLPKARMARKYREGGGKLYVNRTGSRNRIDDCPRCGFKYFDKEPNFDDNRKENSNISGRWATNREHLEEFLAGERSDPPVDDKGKDITSEKMLGSPTLLPELLKCHIIENWNSLSLGVGGKKCVFLCKIKGVQYPAGKCPACLSNCSYVWDVRNHGEAKAYFEMERMRQSTTSEQRAGYNNVLDRA